MSPTRRSATVLLRFALGGALLFVLGRGLGGGPPLRVEVSDDADAGAIATAIDDALLLELAEAQGWPRADAIVRSRLVALLSAVDGEASEAAIAAAIATGLHRRDPIARARLLGAARRALAQVPTEGPTAIELLLELAIHPSAYRSTVHVRFDHRRVPCDVGEAAIEGDARWPRPEVAHALPWLRTRLGDAVVDTLARATEGAWSEPLRGPDGCHRVRVRERSGGDLRPWPRGLVTLLQAVQDRRRAAVVTAELARRRGERTVVIEVVP